MTEKVFPEITDNTILIFDKDGVIFHSEDFKFEYFLSLFDDFNEHNQAIRSYLVGSGGTPRKLRFQHICNEIIGMANTDEYVEAILVKSFEDTDEAVFGMPMVEGAKRFILKHAINKKFVCSGSSQKEVESHMGIHNLIDSFVELHGNATDKSVVISNIKERFGTDILFFGDTMIDYNASIKADVKFVGLRTSNYHDPFKDLNICKVHSFEELLDME